ncbi:helix-turn-helix domain-containing protein [Brochothrix thermosphacta]|uniref:helix-turn-helix domain-containing protein n=1 Tax=Brochothrix thermosphacta TaxID=2756 RepID=UPI0039B112AA
MVSFERLKKLCDDQGISINTLEERIGISKNGLYAWKKKVPGGNNLQLVADYFNVSVDYLLGRTDKKYYDLTKKEKTDIGQEVEAMLNGMNTSSEINFYGEPMTDEAKEKLAVALQVALELSKKEAKKKFTPKKYRD